MDPVDHHDAIAFDPTRFFYCGTELTVLDGPMLCDHCDDSGIPGDGDPA